MKKIIQEFRAFAVKGNAVDMAVGIMIGAAFSTVVNSLVKDIITPPIGRLLGGVDFTNLFVTLSRGSYATLAEAEAAGAITINYGVFINAVVSFVLVALVLFFIIKAMNRMQKQEEAVAEPTTKQCQYCKSDIHIQAQRCAYCTAEIN